MSNIAAVDERTIDMACYIIEHNATIREAASEFGIAKTTAHSDLSERLPHLNPALHAEVRTILERNFAERQVRGGRARQEILRQMRQTL